MKNWFSSLNGAITLSAIAWLTDLWRAWLDMMFEYPAGVVQARIDSGGTLVMTLIYTAISPAGRMRYTLQRAATGAL
jgi:hypothetical protein